MNKTELVDTLAENTGLTKKAISTFLDAFIETVSKTLQKEEELTLVGFGTFKVSKRAARTGRNPKTGAPLNIKERKVPQFKPGKTLKENIGS